MPFFTLNKEKISFPPAHFADQEGLLAVGGDVTADWLIAAYKTDAYLWSSPIQEFTWWSPDPRLVLYPKDLIISPEVEALMQEKKISYQWDTEAIFNYCIKKQNKGEMSPDWIMGVFTEAYKELLKKGVAKGLIVKNGYNHLAAAFGAQIGKVFFLEYICGDEDRYAALAISLLIQQLAEEGVSLFDLQKETYKMGDIGYTEMSRNEYISIMQKLT